MTTRRSERKSPATSIPKVKPGTHAALLYGDPSAAGEAIAFVAEGVLGRESCAVLSYARYAERAAAQLRDLHGVDVKRALADGTLALLKGIKQAPSKTPMHKQAPAAAVSADGAQDEAAHPFLNRVNELRKADPKLGEADAMVQAASDDPALYESYRRDLTPDK